MASTTIGPRLRPCVVAAKERLAEGREKLKQQHRAGSPGIQVCARLAELLDAVILDLYEDALREQSEEAARRLRDETALVPHGGYGRRDVAPFSDVDLMLLHTPGATELVAPLAKRLMLDVFDAGLTLGQSVRTPVQACRMALGDAAIFTSLAEARCLAGNISLFERFAERYRRQATRKWRTLIKTIEVSRAEERTQYGETVYLLEPNIKRSRGGLRDIQLLRWVGFARYQVAEPEGLALAGALSKEEQRMIRGALEFLLRTRNEMHFHAAKAYDLLDRVEQVRLGEFFGYKGQEGMLPVEQFMQDYFRHTNGVSQVVSRFVANARPENLAIRVLGPLFSHQVEGDFRVGPRRIGATARGLEKLQADPAETLRLTDLANLYNKGITHATWEAVRKAAPHWPDVLSPSATERFLSLLSQPARLGELLRDLHEMGVLEKIIPGFRHARCLLQFNEYHKYTVDEHCILAVERATEFVNDPGALGKVYQELKPKRTLHLALLIHDLGKGFAEDHSEVGLRIAAETAQRLRLPEAEAETLKFLVHKHLMMSHLAFRRDTSDDEIVLRFAVDVGSPERLRMLYLLTAADVSAVGPGVWNNWKAEVLTDLYYRTMEHLAGESMSIDSAERFRQRREAVRQCLAELGSDEWYKRQIDALPRYYLYRTPPEQIAAELKELQALSSGEVIARGRYLRESHTVEFTVMTNEDIAPGVFYRLTGALSGKGLQILSAEINTLADGLVCDRFYVVDPDFHAEPAPERMHSVTRALVESLTTRIDQPPTFRKIWRPGSQKRTDAIPMLPTQVRIDNSTSDRFTNIDVFSHDRMGLLYTVTRTLFETGVSVAVAKIGTYLDQVVDVFYVTNFAGDKIVDEHHLHEIRTRLLQAIEEMDRVN